MVQDLRAILNLVQFVFQDAILVRFIKSLGLLTRHVYDLVHVAEITYDDVPGAAYQTRRR